MRAQQGAPSDTARIEKFKTAVIEGVESRRKLAQVMNDTVFSFGELAYQEFETSKYLTEVLEKNGFKVERGNAGIPTAWVARWGSGHPIIALGSDIDCIPKANQKPGVAYRDEIAASGARVVVFTRDRPADLPAHWEWAQGVRLDADGLTRVVPDLGSRHAYISGPAALIAALARCSGSRAGV